MDDRIIRRAEVEALIGLTERQLRTLEAEDRFPKRFLIVEGGRAVGWLQSEIQEWIAARAARREQINKPGILKPGERPGAAT